jgi:hypothetical protein
MKKISTFIKVHFLFFDSIIVFIVYYSLRYFVTLFGYNLDNILMEKSTELYPIFFSSGLTLLGFLLTGISIMIIFLDNKKLEPLHEHGHTKSIFNIYFSAIRLNCLFVGISILGLIISINEIVAHITGLFLFLFSSRIIRCIWIIEEVVKIIYKNKF